METLKLDNKTKSVLEINIEENLKESMSDQEKTHLMVSKARPILIGMAGGTACGKTTLCKKIYDAIGK